MTDPGRYPVPTSESLVIARPVDLLFLLASAAALLGGNWIALPGLLVFGGLFLLRRRRQAHIRWLVPLFVIAVVLLGIGTLSTGEVTNPAHVERVAEQTYREIWQHLDDAAGRTASRLTSQIDLEQQVLRVFTILDEEAGVVADPAVTLQLFDRDGEVVAWGGKGLVHEIDPASRPTPGRSHIASFSAVTLLSTRPVAVGDATWLVIAGTSLRTDTFPFAPVPEPLRWGLAGPHAPMADDLVRVSAGDGPDLVFERVEPVDKRTEVSGVGLRLAQLVWGLALLFLARRSRNDSGAVEYGLILAPGLWLVAAASQAPWWACLVLMVAGTGASLIAVSVRQRQPLAPTLVSGVLAGIAVPALAVALGRQGPLPDLGAALWTSSGDLITRLALAVLVWGFLATVHSRGRKPRDGSLVWLLLALTSLLAAALRLDVLIAACGLLVVAGVFATLWLRSRPPMDGRGLGIVVALLASLISAVGWEAVYREVERARVRETLLPAMAPPSPAEIQRLADEMESFLSTWDLASVVPVAPASMLRQDLAFEIWHESPLSAEGGLSAVRAQPNPGGRSAFSYGLPMNEERWVDWGSPLFRPVPVAPWENAVIVGDGEVALDGESWAYVEYALQLEPGFRLRPDRQGDLAEVLLRAGPGFNAPNLNALGEVRYGLWSLDGRPIVSPWPRSPDLPPTVRKGGEAIVETPQGRAFAFSETGVDGLRVLFLMCLSPVAEIERVGTHVLPVLLGLALLLVVLELPGVFANGLRASWYEIWHSYSKRLVLVYSILLLLPLAIVNYLVVRAFEERLVRDQEEAGLEAVESAQEVLGEFVLTLRPGIGLDAALDDARLRWLSSIIHHDVNLYWRGSVHASSKSELFTAGLLPGRIPGEIYADLTLRGDDVSLRTNRAGRSEYLELYAPLVVPGISTVGTRLIVALPMLAQQQETAEQIATLRRRTLLGSAVVVLLIVAIGWRLARRFTTPLTDIVEGTARIAAGASRLDLAPVELELRTLVEAIDEMATRIHASREELLREKGLVDRMVENITAGVVSLDDHRRVLMANRAAVDLLGLSVGDSLDEAIAADRRLAPLADSLAEAESQRLAQRSVTLQDRQGNSEEWTVVWVPLPGPGEPSALLVLEDVTEISRGQRLQAWAEMARMIAHEIKNPLTPIRLSAEHMREVWSEDPQDFSEVFESCTTNILRQVDELQQIAGEFSTYSRIPKFDPQPSDLVEVVRQVVDGYQAGLSNHMAIELECVERRIDAMLDGKLLGRALRNLIENALRVTPPGGVITIGIARAGVDAEVSVADRGPGVRETLLQAIFDPYFSTHDAGTGLGLPIARRIVEEHGGDICAKNRPGGGLVVTLRLPLRSGRAG